jgi:ATP-dependent Clp protease ATP-binding subunit ClpA
VTAHHSEQTNPVPSERFQRVLAFASDEADGLGHGFVTCHHLLYALARESKGLASTVLYGLGITAQDLHDYLIDTDAAHDRTPEARIDLADEVRGVLDRGAQAAREWGHAVLDTEHLLYGLAAAPTSADEIFAALRVSPNDVLKAIFFLKQTAPPEVTRDEATHTYRFAIESAWLLSLAADIACRYGAPGVSTLHLLVAMLALPGPTQTIIVDRLGLQQDALDHCVQGPPLALPAPSRLPLGGDLQRALGYSIGEAWQRGHQAISPLHLAMGIARSERNAGLDALAELGISQADFISALETALPPSVLH